MASVVYDRATRDFGTVVAVSELSLEIADAEFMVLVGPSGCGKTTALRLLAGLEPLTDGHIRIGERVVDELPPRERDIAMVFQDYALYPQMSVRQNLAFGLRIRKLGRAEIARRVERAAGLLAIEPLLERKPRELSGGQRQRVALGRRWSAIRRSSSWTNRSRISTRSCGRRPGARSSAFSARSARRPCT